MTNLEREALWEQYPEVREMFEEYNDILLEDDSSWERLVGSCHEIAESYGNAPIVEFVVSDTAYQLEQIARRRHGG